MVATGWGRVIIDDDDGGVEIDAIIIDVALLCSVFAESKETDSAMLNAVVVNPGSIVLVDSDDKD